MDPVEQGAVGGPGRRPVSGIGCRSDNVKLTVCGTYGHSGKTSLIVEVARFDEGRRHQHWSIDVKAQRNWPRCHQRSLTSSVLRRLAMTSADLRLHPPSSAHLPALLARPPPTSLDLCRPPPASARAYACSKCAHVQSRLHAPAGKRRLNLADSGQTCSCLPDVGLCWPNLCPTLVQVGPVWAGFCSVWLWAQLRRTRTNLNAVRYRRCSANFVRWLSQIRNSICQTRGQHLADICRMGEHLQVSQILTLLFSEVPRGLERIDW